MMSTLVIAVFRLTRDDYVNIQTFISSGNDIDDCIHWPLSKSRHNINKRKRYFCDSAQTNHKISRWVVTTAKRLQNRQRELHLWQGTEKSKHCKDKVKNTCKTLMQNDFLSGFKHMRLNSMGCKWLCENSWKVCSCLGGSTSPCIAPVKPHVEPCVRGHF